MFLRASLLKMAMGTVALRACAIGIGLQVIAVEFIGESFWVGR